jgi:hypothetical protein
MLLDSQREPELYAAAPVPTALVAANCSSWAVFKLDLVSFI